MLLASVIWHYLPIQVLIYVLNSCHSDMESDSDVAEKVQ